MICVRECVRVCVYECVIRLWIYIFTISIAIFNTWSLLYCYFVYCTKLYCALCVCAPSLVVVKQPLFAFLTCSFTHSFSRSCIHSFAWVSLARCETRNVHVVSERARVYVCVCVHHLFLLLYYLYYYIFHSIFHISHHSSLCFTFELLRWLFYSSFFYFSIFLFKLYFTVRTRTHTCTHICVYICIAVARLVCFHSIAFCTHSSSFLFTRRFSNHCVCVCAKVETHYMSSTLTLHFAVIFLQNALHRALDTHSKGSSRSSTLTLCWMSFEWRLVPHHCEIRRERDDF